MGRFYEALKEAARSSTVGTPSIPDLEEEQPAAPIPPRDVGPAAAHKAAAPLKTPETTLPEGGIAAAAAAMGTPAAPDRIELGKPVHLDIDQRAPVIPHCPDPTVVEQYLRLRVKILQVQEVQTFRTLVVCSPGPKEGKTVTTVNLGVAFGKLPGYRVLVVDADLRRGGLGKWMGAAGYPGFSNLLDGSAQLEDVVLKSDDMPVHFVFRGTSGHQAGELLHSPRLRESLLQMAGHYDLVLLDSAPVTLLMDTQQLARSCDAALLVARAYSTSRKALRQAMDELSGTRIIGTVLNSSARSRIYRRYNNYYGEGK